MSGLEILGAVAAAVDLAKVLHSCLKFLAQIRHGFRHLVEQRGMCLHLVVQAIQFERWCDIIQASEVIQLMESDPRGWPNQPPFVKFHRRLASDLRFDNDGIAQLVIHTVHDLKKKFEEAWNILNGYVVSARVDADANADANADAVDLKQSDLLKAKKKWYQLKRAAPAHTSRPEGQRVDTISPKIVLDAVKWAGTDKKLFRKRLDDIVAINASLLTLLQLDQQTCVKRRAVLGVLQDAGAETFALIDPPHTSELQILAELRSFQDNDHEEPLNVSNTARGYHSHVYHIDDFEDLLIKFGVARSLAKLNHENVVIEWKYFSRDKSIRLERSLRLSNLVGLLNHHDLHAKFLTPKCKGLVADDVNSRLGIIFRVPTSAPEINPSFRNHDLQSFIRTSRDTPALGERLAMAKQLASAVHHLHSVHWLHKSVRSDNIMFFEKPGITVASSEAAAKSTTRSSDDVNAETSNPLTAAPPPMPKLYLLGWDMSRPDHPSEFSESLSNSAMDYQNHVENSRLYSHPETHISPHSIERLRYRAQFDIYSLGLVLLEIGLWRTLDTIRRKCDGDQQFRERLLAEYCDKLLAKMGVIYWRVTQRCIANDFDLEKSESSTDEDYHRQVAFERQVVTQLERCCA